MYNLYRELNHKVPIIELHIENNIEIKYHLTKLKCSINKVNSMKKCLDLIGILNNSVFHLSRFQLTRFQFMNYELAVTDPS